MLGPETLKKVESAASQLLNGATERVSVRSLSERLLGTRPCFAPMSEAGTLARVNGQWRIYVRKGTLPARARWIVAHEIGHWFWETKANYRGYDIEARCDALGAALVAPAAAVTRSVANGQSVHALASSLGTTQSIALLRLGEVCGQAVALIRKDRSTIIRGPFVPWPVPLSWQPVKRAHGLQKVRIADEPGKVGVRLVS